MHAGVPEGPDFEMVETIDRGRLNIGALFEDRKGAIDEPATARRRIQRLFARVKKH